MVCHLFENSSSVLGALCVCAKVLNHDFRIVLTKHQQNHRGRVPNQLTQLQLKPRHPVETRGLLRTPNNLPHFLHCTT